MATENFNLPRRLVRFGEFEVDFDLGELRRNGRVISIQNQPLTVLRVLIERQGEIVGRDELRKALWSEGVYVDFDKNLSTAVNKLRQALGDARNGRARYIDTVPRKGYRFRASVENFAPAVPTEVQLPVLIRKEPIPTRKTVLSGALLAAGIAIAFIAGTLYHLRARPPLLTDKDTVVLADFANSTGDPVFDETLKTALSVSLKQSPFLDVSSDINVNKTLRLMEKPSNTKLTPDVTRELCQRAGSQAHIAG